MDLSRLTKLLALTASESDGEALNAIRAANAFLKKHSLTWPQVVTNQRIIEKPSWLEEALRKQHEKDKAERLKKEQELLLVPMILAVCIDHYRSEDPDGTTHEFLLGLQGFYHVHGYLTARQKEALQKIFKQVKETA